MGERVAPEIAGGISAFLYAADGDDREVPPDKALVEGLADEDLLWVDVDASWAGAVDQAAGLIPLEVASLSGTTEPKPFIRDYGGAFVLGVLPLAAAGSSSEPDTLVCAVGRDWPVTVHQGGVESLGDFADHLRGDSALGRLRRRLSPHRQVFSTLSHPSSDVISGSPAARESANLGDRLEMAVQAVDATREMIVGAFDVFMTQTAQRTNDVMPVLTTVSVVLLSATVIAGMFGMNMLPKHLLHSRIYWTALVLMVVVSGGLLLTTRARYWR